MEKTTVAVIGAGPAGLSMLKALRDDGFSVTLFERRDKVGGLWAYSKNPLWTSALPQTQANISKFTCGFTDYPMPDRYPTHLSQQQFQEFIEEYATNFGLLKNVVLNADVKRVARSDDDTKWLIDIEKSGSPETVEFDKVVFCHGYQTLRNMPVFPGQDEYEGILIHGQEYRDPELFKGKKVVVLGIASTSNDIIPDLINVASKVYISHRRGAIPARQFRNGVPADLLVTWRRRQLNQTLQRYFPRLQRWLADVAVRYLSKTLAGIELDPAWRLEPFPSIMLHLPGLISDLLPLLQDGSLTSLYGIKRFRGGRAVEFDDGTVIEDVDAVICCTGYTADWSVAPFVESSTPTAHGYRGAPIPRLFMNTFPPKYADSCAMLCFSAFGKNNGFSFADVLSLAISNSWRGVSPLPPLAEMERWVDRHQEWLASNWAADPLVDVSMVKQWEFQGWQHAAAGTGMENLGWGWKGWAFWLRDRRMYDMMNNGVETAHMFRYFETGKRRTWAGAREAIIHQNELVKELFPLKEGEEEAK